MTQAPAGGRTRTPQPRNVETRISGTISMPPILSAEALHAFRRAEPLDANRELQASEPTWSECWTALEHELSRTPNTAPHRLRLANFAGRLAHDRLMRPDLAHALGDLPPSLTSRLREQAQIRSLSQQLLECEQVVHDRKVSPETRAAAWLEWGILAQQAELPAQRSLDAFAAALNLVPNHALALDLLWRTAWAIGQSSDAAIHLSRLLAQLDLRRDPLGVDLTLALAHLQNDAVERRRLLDKLAVLAPDHLAPYLEMLLAALGQNAKLPQQALGWLTRLGDGLHDPQQHLHFEVLSARLVAQSGGKLDHEHVDRLSACLDTHDPAQGGDILDDLIDLSGCGALGPLESLPPAVVRWLAHAALGENDRRDLALRILARAQALARPREREAQAGGSVQWLERWVHFHPCDPWAAELVVDHLSSIGHWHKARDVLERWAQTSSTPHERAAVWLRLARVLEHLGEHNQAIAAVERAYGECPGDPECTRALGRAYEQAAMWNQAMRVLANQAAEQGDVGEQVIALHRLAHLAERGDADIEQALATLARAAELAPDDRMIQLDLASLARRSDRMPLLAEVLTRLVKIADNPRTRAALHYELGTILHHRLARRDEARLHFENAHHLAAGHPRFRRGLAEVLARSGQREAFEALALTVSRHGSPAQLAELAWLARDQLSDITLAAELCRQVCEREPNRLECARVAISHLLNTGRREAAYDLAARMTVHGQDPAVAAEAELERFALLVDLPLHDIPEPHVYARALSHCEQALSHAPRHQGALERLRIILSMWGQLARLDNHERNHAAPGGPGKWIATIEAARRAVLDPERQREVAELYLGALAQHDDPCLRHEVEWALLMHGDEKTQANWLSRASSQASEPTMRAALAVEAAELYARGIQPDLAASAKLTLFALKHDPGNPHAVLALEQLLAVARDELPLRQAVGARAVRPQSTAERAIFYYESAEILESGGFGGEAHVAYQAVEQTLSGIPPVSAGLARTKGQTHAPEESSVAAPSRPREANPEPAARRPSQELAVLAGMVARALATRDLGVAQSALTPLGQALQRDPNVLDAVRLAVSLARENVLREQAVELLGQVGINASSADVRFEAWLTMADVSQDHEQAFSYYERAVDAAPHGKAALDGMLRLAKQLGDPMRLSEAIDRYLQAEVLDAEQTQILRREQLSTLIKVPGATHRALSLAQAILHRSPDDVVTMATLIDLLERNRNYAAAAKILAQLIALERNSSTLHGLYLRQAGLLAQTDGQIDAAIAAVENAVMLRPDDRPSVDRFIALLSRAGRLHLLDTYAPQLRAALLRRLQEGRYTHGDLALWLRLTPSVHRRTLASITALQQNVETSPPPQGSEQRFAVGLERLRRYLQSERHLPVLRSPGEPPGLANLLALLEPLADDLAPFLPSLAEQALGPVPSSVLPERVDAIIRGLGPALGWLRPTLQTYRRDRMVLILPHKPGLLRMSENYWTGADLAAQRGLFQLALARALWGAPRLRSLSAGEIDLLLAAAFDTAGVFNAITATPDSKTLSAVSNVLRRTLVGAAAHQLLDACDAIATFDFVPGKIAEELAQSDLRLACLITGEVQHVLLGHAALQGQVQGTPLERVAHAPLTSTLLLHLASEATADLLAAG